MTVSEMSKLIGKPALFHVDKGFKVAVVIQDARRVFNRTDYFIVPVDGQGSLWVSADRVNLEAQ